MSRLNQTATPKNRTENLAGGKAWKQTPELELASILLTSFVKVTIYELGQVEDSFGMIIAHINMECLFYR